MSDGPASSSVAMLEKDSAGSLPGATLPPATSAIAASVIGPMPGKKRGSAMRGGSLGQLAGICSGTVGRRLLTLASTSPVISSAPWWITTWLLSRITW